MICLTMIMYFAVIAYVPFALSGCIGYLIWHSNSNWYPNLSDSTIAYEFQAYGQALYAITVVSLVGWVS